MIMNAVSMLCETSEIIAEKILRKPTQDALAEAEAEGFDGSKLWYHGTRRRFNAFELNKRNGGGFDELGQGIYLTAKKWLANTWAKDGGHLLTCVIRKGPLFDLEKIRHPDDATLELLSKGYIHYQETRWPHPTDKSYKVTYENFLDAWKSSRYRDSFANLCLSAAGYVGGYRVNSQIEGQVVVFKSEDVRIIARNGGKNYIETTS